MRYVLVLLAFGILSCETGSAGRIEVLLRTSDWIWNRDRDADFQATIPLNNGRTQRVVIRQRAFETERGKMREILSMAQRLDSTPQPGLMQHLLEASVATEVWGHWGLIKNADKNQFFIVYIVKIPENASQSLYRRAILETAHVADHWERLMSALDQF